MAIIFDRGLAQWFGVMTGAGAATPSMSVIFPPWSTMLWGGIGGIVGALYSLHWHVAELQDFDPAVFVLVHRAAVHGIDPGWHHPPGHRDPVCWLSFR